MQSQRWHFINIHDLSKLLCSAGKHCYHRLQDVPEAPLNNINWTEGTACVYSLDSPLNVLTLYGGGGILKHLDRQWRGTEN